MTAPNISIIIPALNEGSRIRRAVASAWATGAQEVLVVDGGSTDDTVRLAQQAGAHVISSPAGRAQQQNAGANVAVGDYLVFQHADNWFDSDALKVLQGSDPPSIGAFRQRIEAAGVAYRLLEWGNAARVRICGLPYGDQGIFMRRGIFEQLGGFPDVRLMEDLLLMRSARRVSRPRLLPGPIHVDARRWQRHGVLRQTALNFWILAAHRLGKSPDDLAKYYRRHD